MTPNRIASKTLHRIQDILGKSRNAIAVELNNEGVVDNPAWQALLSVAREAAKQENIINGCAPNGELSGGVGRRSLQ